MIIFFGPAGAGKSMQGQMLAARHNWRWLSSGQLLRDTYDAKLLKIMSEGKLVPNDAANKIMSDAIARAHDVDRIILDGFPRELSQAQWLIDNQERHARAISLVIVLTVPKNELHDRLKLRGRLDDTPEVIDERLEQYATETGEILDLFTADKIAIEVVDGTGTVGEVHDRIEAALEAHKVVETAVAA